MKDKLTYFGALKYLSKYMRKYKTNFICFYIGGLLDSVLAIGMPILFGVMIDEIVYYQNVSTFVKIAIFLLFYLYYPADCIF